MPLVVNQRADLAAFCTNNKDIASLQSAALYQHGRNCAAAFIKLRLNHNGFRRAIRIGLEFHDFGLKRKLFEQIVQAGFLKRGDFNVLNIAAHRFDNDFMFKQTLTHLLWICAFLIDLIDGHDHRHIGSLGMLNGFNRLRHKAVVCCHHQNDDIGY